MAVFNKAVSIVAIGVEGGKKGAGGRRCGVGWRGVIREETSDVAHFLSGVPVFGGLNQPKSLFLSFPI